MLIKELIHELEIIAHCGAEHASSALSTFLQRPVTLQVVDTCMVPLPEIPQQMGGAETLSVGLISRVTGEVEGNALLLFEKDDAVRFTTILGARVGNSEDAGLFGEIEQSMLAETANITISSFMNIFSSHLNERVIPNAPVFLLDMVGSILSVALMENAEAGDTALLFSTRFLCEEENLRVLMIFLPSPQSLEMLQKGLLDD